MRMSIGWRQILGAWGLVLLFVLMVVGGMQLAPCLADTPADLHGVRIPQYDPFSVGASPSGKIDDLDDMELDEGALGGRHP